MKIELKGLDELINNLENYERSTNEELSNVVRKTAFKIQANAKGRTPVDTGHLKRNIKVDVEADGNNASVKVDKDDVEYAEHVEFGTRKTKAQPFLFPAHEEERNDFIDNIKKALSDK